jgi:hypothetical protein
MGAGISGFELKRDTPMQFAALDAEKTLVDRFARQRVAKTEIVAALFDDQL